MNDKYLHLTIDDLLNDDAFIDWVVDKKQDKEWSSWLRKNQQRSGEIKSAKKLISGLSFRHEVTPIQIKDRIWSKIVRSTQAKETSLKSNNKRKFLYAASIAAAIAFLTIFMWPDSSLVYNTDQLMAQTILLPAKSEVFIEPSSSLSYKKGAWGKSRNVELDGRAHFSVSKGVPFTVQTDNGRVKVLGTEFDVVSSETSFYVKVSEGRVNSTSDNFSEILTTNMAFYKNPQWDGNYAITDEWKTDRIYFVFKDQPLSNVLKALTFHYDLRFETSAIDDTTLFSGSFDTGDDLDASLQAVFWTLNINYDLKENEKIVRLNNS